MPDGKPDKGVVFFVYRAKVFAGSSMHTAGAITEEQHRAICLILQGKTAFYEGEAVENEVRDLEEYMSRKRVGGEVS
jgi:hypothetical protein